jgi:hypothetical protein
MNSINESNDHNEDINNEIYNLFEKAAKTINIASIINLLVTAIIIIIVIVNSIIRGFNNYHAILIQLIILNITFMITINYTINFLYCGIHKMINAQSEINSSYNAVHDIDNANNNI